MPLRVFIKDLVIAGKHGVNDHEKESPQRFNVTVELNLAATKATISDNLLDTADWSRLRRRIIAIVEGKSYNLIERLAMEIAAKLLEDKRIAKAIVTIDKIDAFESGIPGVRLEVDRTAS
ncbi:MAG TPA: dihydroneopterin aldolase [Candidatus Saccharimonadales bacterium]|nr:dihydroneopterin aldolase [Candidatus Saccharimonadales bacterium]